MSDVCTPYVKLIRQIRPEVHLWTRTIDKPNLDSTRHEARLVKIRLAEYTSVYVDMVEEKRAGMVKIVSMEDDDEDSLIADCMRDAAFDVVCNYGTDDEVLIPLTRAAKGAHVWAVIRERTDAGFRVSLSGHMYEFEMKDIRDYRRGEESDVPNIMYTPARKFKKGSKPRV